MAKKDNYERYRERKLGEWLLEEENGKRQSSERESQLGELLGK
jgi:hypothetical protein